MKKMTLILSVAIATLSAWAGDYTVKINFADKSLNGQKVYLTDYDSGDTLATSTVKGKVAVIKGKTQQSFYSRLIIAGQRCGFIVEDGKINIDWKSRVATSPLNNRLEILAENIDKIEDEETAATLFYQAYEENKNNGIGPWAFYNYLMCKPLTLDMLNAELAKVPEHYQSLVRIQNAISNVKAQDMTKEGKMFTDFEVTGDDGKPYKLSDFVGKGSYTLVDFWASWCGPCRREMPNIKALYSQYNGNGMNFLGVAVWDAPADTRKAMKQMQLPWPVIVGNQKLDVPTKLYGIMGIPHIIIFDPQGRIVSRGLQGKELADKVNELMAK